MRQATLDNGLKVIVQENHASRVVATQVWVRVGSADERPDEAGLAHVHEHMLFKGTERRPVGAIASAIESAGGNINAWTSYDQTVYHVTMASKDFDVGLDVLADAVQHSAFDADELSKELEVVLEEVSRGNDMPGRVVFQNLFSSAFTKHPYSRPVIGTVESVKSFTRDKILAFYKKWYRPKNMCLVVAGDVDADAVIARAQELFSSDDDQDAPLPERPRTAEPAQSELRWVRASKDIQETHLGVAWHGVALSDPDTPALDILSIVLGVGDSSRLNQRVHREQQLVNECYCSAYTPQDPGVVMIGGTIHGERVEEAYRALLTETLRLKYAAPSTAEVEKAKTILLADAVYGKETVEGVARKMGYFELVAGDPEYEAVYYARVREVTPEDVRQVAEKYLDVDRMSVSVLLPDAIADKMAKETVTAIAREVDDALQAEHTAARIEIGPERTAKVRLVNGTTVLVREDGAVPLVTVRTAAKGGLLAELPANNGVTYLAGELLVRGTDRLNAEALALELDSAASGITGVSGKNSLGVRGDFLGAYFERGLELISECMYASVFDPDEIERARKTQIEDIAARQDSMSAVAFEQLASAMFGAHPYGMPVMGTKASVSALSREDIMNAAARQLDPERLVVSIVGAVDVARAIALAEAHFGHRKSSGQPPVEAPPAAASLLASTEVRTHRDREQAHLVLGFPGVDLFDERRWPLELLTTVLSGQGGRLFLELRDKQSLCYSVSAFSSEGLAPGYFAVYMGTSQDKLTNALDGIRAELERVLETGVTAEELARAQRYLIGTHEVALQRNSAKAGSMALNEAYGLGYDAFARYAERVSAVTLKSIAEAAREVIRFDRSVLSVVEARADAEAA